MALDRTERQRQGVQKWINAGCRGTLQWSTGVGINKNGCRSLEEFNELLLTNIGESCDANPEIND